MLFSAPVWANQARQMCLSCHSSHYTERGKCSGCHRGNPASERKNIAHAGLIASKYAQYTIGEPSYLNGANNVIEQYSCRRCHISNGRGNRLAVNLDASAARKTPEELLSSIRRPVNNMPDFRLNDEQVTLLVNAILAGSQTYTSDADAPVAVHFINANKSIIDIFTRTCGSCHRLLSERGGALGFGDIGPNLSGLFSANYPKTFRGEKAWTFENIKLWLKNPREFKFWAGMRPIKLTEKELKELESILIISSYSNIF